MTEAAGIPTLYAGVQFRSRAEARWAAFFDIVGWRWEYEPFDLDGYIPDFLILGPLPMLVEIKGGAITSGEMAFARPKIERAAEDRGDVHALLLGAEPLSSEYYDDVLGDLYQREMGWAEAVVSGPCGKAGISVFHAVGAFTCALCGTYSGGGGPHTAEAMNVRAAWAKACNVTQWRP